MSQDPTRYIAPGDAFSVPPAGTPPPAPPAVPAATPRGRAALLVEVWQTPRLPRRGQPARVLKRLATVAEVISATAERRIREPDVLRLVVPLHDPAWEYVTPRATIITRYAGDAEAEAWVVRRITRILSSDDARWAEVEAVAAWHAALADGGLVTDRLLDTTLLTAARTGSTPAELAQWALDAYAGAWTITLGTVASTAPVALVEADGDTPWSLLLKICDAAELVPRFTWDHPARRWTLHLDDADAAPVWEGAALRRGLNLVSLTEERDAADMATRFYGQGEDGLTIADATWRVLAVDGATITVSGHDETSGPVPNADGWFTDLALRAVGSSDAYAITATAGSLTSPATITLADAAHAIVPGDLVQFVDEDGYPVAYIDHPAAVVEHDPVVRVVSRDIAPIANLVRNAAMSAWPAGDPLPTGWQLVGTPTILAQTADTAWGAASVRVEASAVGQGIASPAFTWTKTERLPVLATLAALVLLRGRVRLYLRSEVTGTKYPLTAHATAWHASTTVLGDPERYALSITDVQIPSGDYRVVVVSDSTQAVFAVDAVTVAAATTQMDDITLGSGAQELHRAVCIEALREHTPRVRYRADLAHLYRADPRIHEGQRIRVGAALLVRDEVLGVTERLRVVALSERLDVSEATGAVELSDERRDMLDLTEPTLAPITAGITSTPSAMPPASITTRSAARGSDAVFRAWLEVTLPDRTHLAVSDPADQRYPYAKIGSSQASAQVEFIPATTVTPFPGLTLSLPPTYRITAPGTVAQGDTVVLTVPAAGGEYADASLTLTVPAVAAAEQVTAAFAAGPAGSVVRISMGGQVIEIPATHCRIL
jgi:uncharacterized protein YbdZ (MbtH family)